MASVIASPSPNYDYGYYSSIQVGSQSFEIHIDTGSDALWLLSNQLPATATGAGHTLYTPGPSASQVGTFKIVYDDNSGANGPAYADKVILGGATVTSQAVGAASSVAPVVDGMNSGVLGLGFASTSSKFSSSTPGSFMGNLKSQLASPLFTVDLHNDATGNLNFGFIDSTKYRGSITYVPRLAQYTSAWLVTPGTYTIGNTVSSGTLAPIALIDTGTSLIIVPNSVVGEYYAKVPGAFNSTSGCMYPCTNLKNNLMPPFGINLGGTVFTVAASYMFSVQHNATYCYGVLEGTTGTQAFLGDIFLRHI